MGLNYNRIIFFKGRLSFSAIQGNQSRYGEPTKRWEMFLPYHVVAPAAEPNTLATNFFGLGRR